MEKISLTDCLRFFGIFIWISTMFLSGKYFLDNKIIYLYLGIAPNIGATWSFAYFSEKIFLKFQQIKLNIS